jgi:hypothetical protein
MRVFRLGDTSTPRAATIHAFIRQVRESARSMETGRTRQIATPWMATR